MTPLIFQSSPTVTIATNKFSNVPTILQFDYTPLISVVKEDKLGFTPEVPIHHSDGTYLGKVRGNRFFPTEDGKKAGVNVRQLPDMTVCEMGSNTG